MMKDLKQIEKETIEIINKFKGRSVDLKIKLKSSGKIYFIHTIEEKNDDTLYKKMKSNLHLLGWSERSQRKDSIYIGRIEKNGSEFGPTKYFEEEKIEIIKK